ncbi:hypothetical protein N431DRAFT_428635 [Stipitochalara longipes BDJ]|nr:hypothetical protein N431DRAFT_428635 [Stipitochalara longipes BDJ]
MAENSSVFDDPGEDEGITIELSPADEGDEGSAYRTQNDPSHPHQRSNIVERQGSVDVRCVAVDVVHGSLEPDGAPATLLVFDFQFDARRRARRILEAHMSFTFASAGSGSGSDSGPIVLNMAPKGRMTVVQTQQTETITRSGEANAGGGALGATLGGGLKWEKSVSRETSDATTVVGSLDLVGRNFGASNGVSWALLENRSVNTGVPAFVRTAVLLQRADHETEFHATFKICAQADLRSSIERLFGKTPKDDPILYDPSLPPTNKLRKYEVDNLGKIDLNDLSAVAFTNSG